jgi:glucose-1-phosphatase
VIVWDLGGVVARFDPAARLAALAAATGLTPRDVEGGIWASGLDAAAERGELAEERVWAAVLAALGNRIDRDGLRRCWAVAFQPDPVVLACIDGLAGPHALLTDNGPILEACLQHELQSIAARFDSVLLSWRLGTTKGDPTTFERAADELGLPPSRLTLVDDVAEHVANARAAGWNAVHFESIDVVGAELAAPSA